MMLLETIRRRFHPLHVLRRARVAKYFGILDIRLPVRVHGVDRRIYVRLLRHLSSIIDNRLIETELTALIRVLVARDRPAMFWDIGAHIGFYSWMFLTLSPSGHVVMFEPDPGNRDLIRRTLAGDMNPNVVVLPYAISDENGEAVFERDPISGATGGLTRDRATFVARNFGIAAPTMTVATHTLDRIMESPKFAAMPPALIKMDIEGAELQALRGGRALFTRHRPVLLYESFSEWRDEARQILDGYGYVVFPANAPDGRFEAAVEFLALPRERADEFPQIAAAWSAEIERWRRMP